MKAKSFISTQVDIRYFIFSVIFSLVSLTLQAQNIGDYRSFQSGNWTNTSSWQLWDGINWITPTSAGYPGQNLVTPAPKVEIQMGHVITVSNDISTQPMANLTINGQLFLSGNTSKSILVGINVHEIRLYGTINFLNKVILNLVDNTVVIILGGGDLTGDCSNNQEIQIGGQKIAACNGAPGDIYTFRELVQARGTLDANIISPVSGSSHCFNNEIVLSGSYKGVYGTTTPNGTTGGVNYSWYVDDGSTPVATGTLTMPETPTTDVFLPPLAVGTHSITFTVTTYNGAILYTNSITNPVTVTDNFVWTGGAADKNWHNSANWSPGCIPTNLHNVQIPSGLGSNYPTISSTAEVNNIVIKSGATLLDNGLLTVHGTANVEQNLSVRNCYMSSPVTCEAFPTIDVGTLTLWEYPEDHATLQSGGNCWLTPTCIQVGKGYIVSPNAAGTITFSGVLNKGAITIGNLTNSTTTNPVKHGFHLLGNPYPSYLNWRSSIRTNMQPTIWYRTKVGTVYQFYTYSASTDIGVPMSVTRYIPPLQSFWVRVNSGTGSVLFNDTMRTHRDNETNLLRAKANSINVNQILRLSVTNGTGTDETVVYFNANALDGLDAYDSPKMMNGSSSGVPDIYTKIDNEILVINGMNTIPYDTEIPVYFNKNAASSTQFTISANQFSNFDANTQVWIKNKLSGLEQLISDGTPYVFDISQTGTNPMFSIIIKAPGTTTKLVNTNNSAVFIYQNANKQIAVTCNDALNADAKVTVYNSLGQRIVSKALTGNVTLTDSPMVSGVYLVTVINAGDKITEKIIIR